MKPEDYPHEMAIARRFGLLRPGILPGCAMGLLFPAFAAGISPVSDDAFLRQAVAAYVGASTAASSSEEDTWTLAAAPLLDFRAHPAALGRLWLAEVARGAG
ncbi:MAG: hypothetical protein WAU32_07245, partial [Thermoanaerobaculia bacterium]